MGGPGSGRKRADKCGRGLHDLTKPENVQIINRGNGKVDRLCRPCQNERQRAWWRRTRGKQDG